MSLVRFPVAPLKIKQLQNVAAFFVAIIDRVAEGAVNMNPVIVLNGTTDYMPVYMNVSAGSVIKADLSGIYDPDDDCVEYMWWVRDDAGTFDGHLDIQTKGGISTMAIPKEAAGTDSTLSARHETMANRHW